MRFVADEHIPASVIRALREDGHDVFAAATDATGAPDAKLIEIAAGEERIVLTFDKDFGDLLFRAAVPPPPAVVFFRLATVDPAFVLEVLRTLISGRGPALAGQFTVVDEERIRQRPLAPRPAT